jgi:hypothetical protein
MKYASIPASMGRIQNLGEVFWRKFDEVGK